MIIKAMRQNMASRPNRINEEIRTSQVRLINENTEQMGVMSLHDALDLAEKAGLDLVEISPDANPPVCRIIDYGKFLYEKSKIAKKQRQNQKVMQIKEVKFRPGTDEADYQVKLRSLIRFIQDDAKTKVTLRFRGREMVHQNLGIALLERIRNDMSEYAQVDSFPSKLEGRQMTMLLVPKKK